MAEFLMPSLGADMAAGTLHEWCVKPGDSVKRGDVIAEVETDKGVIDVEIWEDGVIDKLLVEPGTEVTVGAVMAHIRAAGEAAPPAESAPPVEKVKPPQVMEEEPHPADHRPLVSPEPATNGKRLRVSPLARKRAAELGVDLARLKGSGPGGAISMEDVEAAVTKAQPAAAERARISPVARKMAADLGVDPSTLAGTGPRGTISKVDIERAATGQATAKAPEPPAPAPPPPKPAAEPPAKKAPVDFQSGMRRAIAAAMAKSNREIPHYYLETHIDMTRALDWLEAENLKRSIKDRILPVVLLVKATAKALAAVPQLNGFWVDDELQMSEAIHIGFAVALRQGGLVTPAIHHADLKSLDELMVDVRDVIMRTRAGRLRSSDLMDSTVTLTNLGDMGVEKVFGVIYPPQVALVGFGKVMEQPWAQNGMLGIRRVVIATVAGDHRATDGRTGGQFLDVLNRQLQEVETL
jgi:pyruvate dehydrogenase E2 component (dihydrolipoamide acetyltransferase)